MWLQEKGETSPFARGKFGNYFVNIHILVFAMWSTDKEGSLPSLIVLRRGVFSVFIRAVTKVSSCGVNTSSRRGIKQLGISFGSIFLFVFSDESRRGSRS